MIRSVILFLGFVQQASQIFQKVSGLLQDGAAPLFGLVMLHGEFGFQIEFLALSVKGGVHAGPEVLPHRLDQVLDVDGVEVEFVPVVMKLLESLVHEGQSTRYRGDDLLLLR